MPSASNNTPSSHIRRNIVAPGATTAQYISEPTRMRLVDASLADGANLPVRLIGGSECTPCDSMAGFRRFGARPRSPQHAIS